MARDILTTLGATTNADGQTHLMHYRIEEQLGEGGMAFVFAAYDRKLQRDVALKVLKPEISRREDSRKRFVQEARSLAAVEHDNVVRVYAVEQKSDLPFIVMERLHGRTLADVLRHDHEKTPLEVVRIAQQIAHGLNAAHARRILHRDVKPQNVWIQEGSGRVKLLDFGLAEPFGSRTGNFGGTPAYISPEQARSEPVDARTDLFSLGVILWQMLTGRLPFETHNQSALLVAIVTKSIPSIAESTEGLPEPLAKLIDSLLSKNKSDRPRSAMVVLDELERCREMLEETFFGTIARLASNRVTIATVGVALFSAVATWIGLNATDRSVVLGATKPSESDSHSESQLAGPNSSRPVGQFEKLATNFHSLKGRLNNGVAEFDVPQEGWSRVVDAMLSVQSDAERLRVFGVFEEGFVNRSLGADGLLHHVRNGSLVELDDQTKGELGWIGNEGFIATASQELVAFLRSRQKPRLLIVVERFGVQSTIERATKINLKVETHE